MKSRQYTVYSKSSINSRGTSINSLQSINEDLEEEETMVLDIEDEWLIGIKYIYH